MKKCYILSILITIAFLYLFSCNRSNNIYIYVPPDTTGVPIQPYTIKVSKYYETIFGTDPSGPDKVQDFDIYGDVLYIWAFYAFGLYEYHLSDGKLIHHGVCGAADCVTADSGRVFWASFGIPIVNSYSLETLQSSQFVNKPDHYKMQGIQVYKNRLYVLYASLDNSPEDNVLDIYSLSGEHIESISYQRETWYMAINQDILYSIYYDTSQDKSLISLISRFSLATKEFLNDVECPSKICDGIRSYGDYFFFTDLDNKFIGYVSLDEIEQRGR